MYQRRNATNTNSGNGTHHPNSNNNIINSTASTTTSSSSNMHMGRRGVLSTSSSLGGGGGSTSYDPERGRLVPSSISEMNAHIMEQQNNDRIAELSEQVSRLKGLTIEIGNEVREQNSLLDQMNDGFTHTSDLLAGSLRKMGIMLERGGPKHMCLLITFIVGIMVILYFLMKHR